jgi:DNA-binding winged helix-turn-helix (wHTH) protein
MATHVTADSPSTRHPLQVRFDAFELDEANARLLRDGRAVPLAPTPFALLCALVRQPKALLTKPALLDEVWGHQFLAESALKTAISDLRAALQDDPKQPRYIETVSRRGYRFIGAMTPTVTPAAATPGAPSPAAARWPARSSIGRADALERLGRAWQLAGTGQRQIVWIAGEAGVGKTTLIERFMAEAGDLHGAHGQCVEQYGEGEPCLPVLEALTALSRRDTGLVELIRAVAPTWLLQLPWLSSAAEREALRRELTGTGQGRMLREMGELLDRYTADRPLLLVTEDLHWSDQATVQLIDYVARRRTGTRLLWLASFRLSEIIGADHPLAAVRRELRLHRLCDEIVLDAFSEKEVGEYLAAHIPELAKDETIVRALHHRTDGLPVFVADVVNDLAQAGHGSVEESTARLRVASMAIPQTLSGIVERYVEQLEPDQRALLEAASVCGVEPRLAIVAQALGRDVASVAQSCEELVRRQRWLTELAPAQQEAALDPGYAFRHALYREVLYKRIGRPARVELHRNVAASLERERAEGRNVSAAELASHFELGREPMAALRYYAEAAESALLHFSPAQTMSLSERALALLPQALHSDARTALEMTLTALRGTAANQIFGFTSNDGKRAYERALVLLDDVPQHPLRGLVLSALGLMLFLRGEAAAASTIAQRSESSWGTTGDRTALICACLVHGLVEHVHGRPRIAREWLEKGVDACDALDAATAPAVFAADPAVITLCLLALELLQLGFVDQGRARMRAASARAIALREPAPQMAALWLEAMFEQHAGDAERVAGLAGRLLALVEEYALPDGRAAHLWFRGWAEAQLGDPRAGYRLIREGHEEALRLDMRAYAGETLGHATEALVRAGDWLAARQQLDEAMQLADSTGERRCLTQLLLLDARIADALGEPARARESVRQAIAEAIAQEALWPQLIATTALCERADASDEDARSLGSLLDRITEGLDTAPVARARALLSRAAPAPC